jgi:hypothetical protein
MGLAALCLFLLIVVAIAWWVYSRWSAYREAEEAREQAAAMFVVEARSQVSARTPLTPESASSFYPTLPEGSWKQDASSAQPPRR